MTARFKDFGAGTGSSSDEPLIFKIHGEDFKCYPQLQGKTMLNLIEGSESGDTSAGIKLMTTFFKVALEPESYARFEALTTDPDPHKIVTMETLSEIIAWLMGVYSGRPESQPEAS